MQYGKLFEDELKVITKNYPENDGFVAAVDYLVTHLKLEDFSHQAPDQVYIIRAHERHQGVLLVSP